MQDAARHLMESGWFVQSAIHHSMRPRTLVLTLALAFATLAALAFVVQREATPDVERLSLADAMRADTAGYALALAPRPFVFPADHGPHPDFRTEWWYFTGNLDGPQDQPFGFELTLFRIALTPPDTARRDTSGWATRQLYMAHFAVTDGAGEQFHAFERFGRGAAGLAGAQAAPFRVWLDDWQVAEGADGMPRMTLRAAEAGVALSLDLQPEKPLVLQGDRGLSQKGRGAGNASYYYSLTRMAATGQVTTPRGTFPVSGRAWMDREWSTSALDSSQVGWDWFALQLSDGRELMYYQLRERGGQVSAFSKGTLVADGGAARRLSRDDVALDVTRTWTSPHSQARYPAGWTLRVPDENLTLRITPLLDDQELNVSVRYWEGAVRVEGPDGLTGRGYVEMTGYDEQPARPTTRGRRG